MKTRFLVLSLLSLLTLTNKTYSQGEAAVTFLLLQPSPSLAAMGQTGTALPTEDPFGFLWNPAQLGYTSQNNNLSFIFYPSKIDWIPAFNADIELKALAFNIGYNFKEIIDFPISIGFGYANSEIDYGTFNITGSEGRPIGTFEPNDYYKAYSFGLGVDYYVQLSIGYTIKDVTSLLADFSPSPDSGEVKAETKVNDFGILLNVPILKLINEKIQVRLDENLFVLPTLNFSLGYSKSNIGDEIVYNYFPGQADPLPRMDKIGYGFSTGFDLLGDDFQMKILNFALTVEADDILIERDTIDWHYQSTLSDLKPWKNLINVEGTDKIVSHIGLKLDLFETLSLSTGHFSGRGFMDVPETGGFELRTKGIFKLWALWAKDPITNFLRDHIDIRYYNTNYFSGDWRETKMTGLALYVHNINSLF
jgi:hypothetical protein